VRNESDGLAAEALGIECNLMLTTQWLVRIDRNEREAFLELAGKCTDNLEN
jgi:hypothetical protein